MCDPRLHSHVAFVRDWLSVVAGPVASLRAGKVQQQTALSSFKASDRAALQLRMIGCNAFRAEDGDIHEEMDQLETLLSVVSTQLLSLHSDALAAQNAPSDDDLGRRARSLSGGMIHVEGDERLFATGEPSNPDAPMPVMPHSSCSLVSAPATTDIESPALSVPSEGVEVPHRRMLLTSSSACSLPSSCAAISSAFPEPSDPPATDVAKRLSAPPPSAASCAGNFRLSRWMQSLQVITKDNPQHALVQHAQPQLNKSCSAGQLRMDVLPPVMAAAWARDGLPVERSDEVLEFANGDNNLVLDADRTAVKFKPVVDCRRSFTPFRCLRSCEPAPLLM